jgi:hypothetical protein
VRLILAERAAIVLPEFPDVGQGENLAKLRTIISESESVAWQSVPEGRERMFDVVLMRGQFRDGGRQHSRPIHIGLVIRPGALIHTEEGSGVTIVPYRSHHMIKSRVESFWRFAGGVAESILAEAAYA